MPFFPRSEFSRLPYILSVLFAVAVLLWATGAEAQHAPRRARNLAAIAAPTPPMTAVQRALGLALGKLCANEASLRLARPADCALIYQASRYHGDTPAERLAFLHRHSKCVLEERAPRTMRGNCPWARDLDRALTRPPAWSDTASWETFSPRWEAMLRFCDRLAAGLEPSGGWPCARDPQTWGGSMDPASGYTPVTCRGTANRGWMYPRVRRNRAPSIADTVELVN